MNLLPIFLVGLMGSVHCIGMCGGIIGALSSAAPPRAPAAPVQALAMAAAPGRAVHRIIPLHLAGSAQVQAVGQDLVRVLGYNLGRLSSCAGRRAGRWHRRGLRGADVLGWLAPAQTVAYVITNLVLILLGLYLTQWWSGVSRMEQLGSGLWTACVRMRHGWCRSIRRPRRCCWAACGLAALRDGLQRLADCAHGWQCRARRADHAGFRGWYPARTAGGRHVRARLRQLAARPWGGAAPA
jgi:sulfite exporter TauE/SafE